MIYEDLKGKKVLVTGSSSGIGVATAVMFAQQGSFLGVHHSNSPTAHCVCLNIFDFAANAGSGE